jgi:TM2 domain-containing membrane protein YozV
MMAARQTQLQIAESRFQDRRKSEGVAYLLWFFLGLVGGHRFYLGQPGYAIALICFGWMTFFIWPLADVFFIGRNLRYVNEEIRRQVYREHGIGTVPTNTLG